MPRITLKQIAERCDTSVQTVGQILNKGREELYRDETVERIRLAAEELGYRPNYLAASLQSGRAGAVGMLSTDQTRTAFWAAIAGAAVSAAQQRDHHFVMVGRGRGNSPIENALHFVQEHRVDALIVPGPLCDDEAVERLEAAGLPAVLVESERPSALPRVRLDDESGIRALVQHVAGLGHRRLLWVGPRGENRWAERRHAAFRRAVEAHGLQAHELYVDEPVLPHPPPEGDLVAAARAAMLARLQKGRPEFTAAICNREVTALGVYAALRKSGLSVPGDVSVTGFDDVLAETAWPPMTVASHMLSELGAAAARLAIRAAEGKNAAPAGHVEQITPELAIRASTAPPRN